MKKKIVYSKAINIKITEQQYQDLQTIRAKSGKSFSELMRDNITFYLSYFK